MHSEKTNNKAYTQDNTETTTLDPIVPYPKSAVRPPESLPAIFVYDPYPTVSWGIALALENTMGLNVQGYFTNNQILTTLKKQKPGLIFAACRSRACTHILLAALELYPGLPIMLYMYPPDLPLARELVFMDCVGVISSETDVAEFPGFINSFLAGNKVKDPALHDAMTYTRQLTDRLALLSPREMDVLRLIPHIPTHREIAEKLGVSRRTVDTHSILINAKLGTTSIAELLYLIHHHGLTD